MPDSIATAYVQIEPTFEGVGGKLKSELGGASESAGASAGKSFGSGFGSVIGGTAKAMGAAVVAGGTALTALGASFVSASGDVASYGDNIDKMSQKMGLTAEAYQEWDAVMQHSGTSMETMKASMKTLANAAETGNAAFEALGITQEDLANMNQQDLFEATIAGLQNVEDDTQRTYLAGKLLGKGATELGALLNTSAEDTQAMRDRVRELGGVMSDDAVKAAAAYQDQLQDMQTAFSGISRNMMSEFLPSITTVMGGLTEIFSGNSDKGLGMISEGISGIANGLTEALPQLMEVAGTIVSSIGQAIINNLPTLLSTSVEILNQIATGIIQAMPQMLPALIEFVMAIGNMIIENLPLLLQAAVQIIVSLATGIAQALPELIPTIVEVVTNIAIYLIENIDLLIDAALQLMIGLATGLINALPVLIEKAPIIISRLFDAIIKAVPKLIEAGAKLIKMLIDGVTRTVPQLIAMVPQIVTDIYNKFVGLVSKFITIGSQLVNGIKEGISSAWDSFTSWMSGLLDSFVDGILSFFGIQSPSKLMADEVGKWIPAGIAEGIEQGMGVLDRAVDDMTADMLSTTLNPSIVQNYAPQAANVSSDLSGLMRLLQTYLPQIAAGDNVNISLEGDAGRLFRLMQRESRRNTELVGVNAALSSL